MAKGSGNGPPSLADVNTEARRLVEKMVSKRDAGHPLGDGNVDAATVAAMMPDFSRGTVPLDENSGQPLAADETLDLAPGEAGGNVDALATADAESAAAATAAPPKERDAATGRFVSEAADDMSSEGEAAPDGGAQPVSQAAAGEAAVEAAAGAALESGDPWGQYEEFEVEDPILEKKFKVRALKDEAAAVRNGYMRQSDYSKKTMFLANLRKAVEPMIGDGRLQQLLPLIQRGMQDQEFGDFVIAAFNRRIAGQPMTQAQAAALEVAQAAAAAPAQGPPQIPTLNESEDPFMAEYLKPYNERLNQTVSLVERMAAQEQARAEQQQRAAAAQQQQIQIAMAAHQGLAARFPDEFSGDPVRDRERFDKACVYARESGYLDAYPSNPLAVVMAWDEYRNTRAQAAASPAVAAVNAAAVERRVAAANAAAVSTGGPATNTAPPPRVPPMPQTRANGQAVDPKVYAAQILARNRAISRQQAQ